MPDITLALAVKNGLDKLSCICPNRLKILILNQMCLLMEKIWIKQLLHVDLFHMELAGSPFDMTFSSENSNERS
ncbi:MAG: hypothetical protein MZV63_10810 [Marinilabiliales bacterium]|nr:hypothetical protein [Marinilabiliales bacterium]